MQTDRTTRPKATLSNVLVKQAQNSVSSFMNSFTPYKRRDGYSDLLPEKIERAKQKEYSFTSESTQ